MGAGAMISSSDTRYSTVIALKKCPDGGGKAPAREFSAMISTIVQKNLRVMCQYSPWISSSIRQYFRNQNKKNYRGVGDILFRGMKTVCGHIALWGSP
jgi:hypothetical protein